MICDISLRKYIEIRGTNSFLKAPPSEKQIKCKIHKMKKSMGKTEIRQFFPCEFAKILQNILKQGGNENWSHQKIFDISLQKYNEMRGTNSSLKAPPSEKQIKQKIFGMKKSMGITEKHQVFPREFAKILQNILEHEGNQNWSYQKIFDISLQKYNEMRGTDSSLKAPPSKEQIKQKIKNMKKSMRKSKQN